MHNAAFGHLGLNSVYMAFKVEDLRKAIEGIRALHIYGVSVTIPHKTEAMKYVDTVDPLAQRIGAINTIANHNGSLIGYNTDWVGAIKSLEEVTDIPGKHFVIVGAGGAARAIAFGIKHKHGKVSIVNRSRKRGEQLAKDLECQFDPINSINDIKADALIHTTPVGMYPHVDNTLIPKGYLKEGMVIMDTIYNPLETKLLKEAKERGCTVIGGFNMLIYQGATQFELWTGKEAPVSIMQEAVYKFLIRQI